MSVIDEKKINEAILEITQLKIKYTKIGTMFVCHALDEALKKLGWDFAKLLENKK